MRKIILILAAMVFALACESKRPDSNGVFTVTLEGKSILKGAVVRVLKEGSSEALVPNSTTDETGEFTIEKIATASTLRVGVCGGTFFSIGTGTEVSFNGCLSAVVPVKETGKETVFVDLVSTLAAAYESDTAQSEVLAYLDLTADSAATEETTLTDATKRYLWQQALSVVAAQISEANGVTPETSLSTEALFTLMQNDLYDNNTIDGSTGTKFGPVLPVNEALIRQHVAGATAEVSANFTAADLADWVEHLRSEKAKFLGAGGEEPDDLTDDATSTDTDKANDPDEESLYPDYDTVDNPPAVEIVAPVNNAVLYTVVSVKAQRTLDSCPILSLSCTLKYSDDTGAGTPLTDTNANPEVFEAAIDTLDLELEDKQMVITCTGSNGIKQAVKSVKFTLANHNPVTVLPYVTDKVTGVAGVAVYDAEGTKVKTLTETAGTVSGDLPPGEYTFAVNGGDYTSVLFTTGTGDPKVVTLSTPLLGRAVIEAGENTAVYVTPLTTIREIIWQGLTEKGGRTLDEAIDDSLALFETHYLDGMNPYAKPLAGQPAENATLNWVAIAALEQLAADIAADKGLSSGAVLMDDILATLAADLVEEKGLFDGRDKNDDPLMIKTFAVDSYLFRYHYAVALKRFIEEETEYTYQDFQTLIYNIAMDESELFPKQDEPIAVVAQAPQIKNLAFKRASDAGFIDYAAPDTIPYVKDALDLRFFVEMADSATIALLDLYFVAGTPLLSLNDLAESGGTYTATGIMVDGEDGEKTLTIRAQDDQNNYGTRAVTIVKDSVLPVVELTPPVAEVIAGDISFDYAVTEERLASEYYTIQPQGGTLTTHPLATPDLSGNILLSEIEDDGTYTVSFYAVDKAANTGSASFTRTIDTTAPAATIAVQTVEDTPRALPTATGWVNANDFNILFSGVTDRPGSELAYNYSVRTGSTQHNAVHTTTGSSWESTQYLGDLPDSSKADLLNTKHIVTGWVADTVGNETERQAVEIYVDTVVPTLTVSDAPANPVNAWTFTYTANDTNMKRVWITDEVGIQTIVTEGQTGTRNYSLDCLTGAIEGIHVVTFRAEDEAGNKAPDVVKNIRIDCTAPIFNSGADPFVGTILEIDNAFIKNDMGSIAVTLSEPATLSYTLLKNNLPTDCNGELSYGGSGVLSVSCPFGTGGADDGAYTFILSATDVAGNKSTEYGRTFTVDTIAPTFTRATSSKTVPWNPFNVTSGTTIQFTGSDTNLDACEFFFNGALIEAVGEGTPYPNSAMTTSALDLWLRGMDPDDTRFIGDEVNAISAECRDRSGNEGTRTFSWNHDITAPSIALAVEPAAVTGTANQTLNFDADEDPAHTDGDLSKVEYRYKTATTAYSNWITRTFNTSGEGSVVFPAASDTTLNDANFWKNKNTLVTLEMRVTDKALNVSATTAYQWIVDKWAPVLTDNGGLSLCLPPTYTCYRHFSFTPSETATAGTILVDGATGVGSCSVAIDGKVNCSMQNDGADHVIKVVATDAYGNTGSTANDDCQSNNWMCILRNIYFSSPGLSVVVNELTGTTLKFTVTTDGDATIQSCKIYTAGGTLKHTCANTTGQKTVDISNTGTWPGGDYRIEVVTRNNTSGNQTTQNTAFTIDRTATSVTFGPACDQYGGTCPDPFYIDRPKVAWSATMAYGVKRLRVWMKDRIVHVQYPHSGYTCDYKTCVNNAYDQLVLDTASASGVMTLPSAFLGGKYTEVSYEVTNKNDDVVTGTISLSPQIKYIKSASEKFTVTSSASVNGQLELTLREPIVPQYYDLWTYSYSGLDGYKKMGYYYNKYWYFRCSSFSGATASCSYTANTYKLLCTMSQAYYAYVGWDDCINLYDPIKAESENPYNCSVDGDCLDGVCPTSYCRHEDEKYSHRLNYWPYESKISVGVIPQAFNFTIPLSSQYSAGFCPIRKQSDSVVCP